MKQITDFECTHKCPKVFIPCINDGGSTQKIANLVHDPDFCDISDALLSYDKNSLPNYWRKISVQEIIILLNLKYDNETNSLIKENSTN